jgi:hypothetical protein
MLIASNRDGSHGWSGRMSTATVARIAIIDRFLIAYASL